MDQKQSLSQIAVLVRTVRVLENRSSQLHDCTRVVAFGHQRPRQTAVTKLPTRIHAEKLPELSDGGIVFALVAISVAQIVAYHRLIRRQTFGFQIFCYSSIKAFQIV